MTMPVAQASEKHHMARLPGRYARFGSIAASRHGASAVDHGVTVAGVVSEGDDDADEAAHPLNDINPVDDATAFAAAEKRCTEAKDCVTIEQLEAWYDRQNQHIKDKVAAHWQKFARDTVDEEYAKNWARIKTAEVKATVPEKFQSAEEAKIGEEYRRKLARINGRSGAKADDGTSEETDMPAIQTQEQLKRWRERQEENVKNNVPKQWQVFAQATIDEEYAKISARIKAVEAKRKAMQSPKSGEDPEASATSEQLSAKAREVMSREGQQPHAEHAGEDAALLAAPAVHDDAPSPMAAAVAAADGSARSPLLAAAGVAAAFALAIASMRAGSWRRASGSGVRQELGAPFLRFDAVA